MKKNDEKLEMMFYIKVNSSFNSKAFIFQGLAGKP